MQQLVEPILDIERPIKFSDITVPTPDQASLARDYAAINALLNDGEIVEAAAQFDRLRRVFSTWVNLVELRFRQNTTDAAANAIRAYRDELLPAAKTLETAFKRRMLGYHDRSAITDAVGEYAVALWDLDIGVYSPAVEAEMEQEAKLAARYTELTASAQIEIGGVTVNLGGLAPFMEHRDRSVRHDAFLKLDQYFAEKAVELDDLYDQLVKLRHNIAHKLGYANFIELGYRRMRRLDYGPDEVQRYREAIATHVTPLAARLVAKKREVFTLDQVYAWDEVIMDPLGNPTPLYSGDKLVAAVQTVVDQMDPKIALLYRTMNDGGFLDLALRSGKGSGGFCTAFPTVGMPYIFANFAGTADDIRVLTHEMGHAFQNFASRRLPCIDYLWPGAETAEIHAMSFELLAQLHADILVGSDAAERFRQLELAKIIAFLPRGACLDHFQHEVYQNPKMTPAERNTAWRKLERHYMPWRNYGDLPNSEGGAVWQRVLHLYLCPFYMIDYALAQCCALQLWTRSRENYSVALEDYIALCQRGGSASFLDLVASAGLISPFASGALEASIAAVEEALR